MSTQPIVIRPEGRQYFLKLRLLSPMAHGDPGQADKSNFTLFRRRPQFVDGTAITRLPTQEQIDELCALYPIPAAIAGFFDELTLPQFVAAILVERFVSLYGDDEGTGLFSGMERYRRLEERFNFAAIRASTLFEFWGLACRELQIPITSIDSDHDLLKLLALPSTLAGLALKELRDNPRPIILFGRVWAKTKKEQSPEYAEAAKVPVVDEAMTRLAFDVDDLETTDKLLLEVPAYSANSARHELVREPAMLYLLNQLDISLDALPPGVAALLYNGGNIVGGTKSLPNAFGLEQIIQKAYPSIALVGGCTDSFIINGNLDVDAWIICQENNEALALAGIQSHVSIFDMLDQTTLTRHSGRVETGQMPYSFETICQGTEILIRFALSPYADDKEIGALLTAIHTYEMTDATVGGQSARGFGRNKVEWLDPLNDGADQGAYQLECMGEYEGYLEDNRDALREGLLTGKLGTDKVVCK